MNAAAEIESDRAWRLREIAFLQNLCSNLPTEEDRDRFRRTLVVMLYAHFEGFVKFALEVYANQVKSSGLKCREVQPALATSALRDIFKALRNPDSARNYLPRDVDAYVELRPLGVEQWFVKHAWTFGERPVELPDDYIDTESNLKPTVLRKNLFRLGLPHDLFDAVERTLHRLLNYRNQIAHGGRIAGIQEPEYEEIRRVVESAFDTVRRAVLSAIDSQAYALPNSA